MSKNKKNRSSSFMDIMNSVDETVRDDVTSTKEIQQESTQMTETKIEPNENQVSLTDNNNINVVKPKVDVIESLASQKANENRDIVAERMSQLIESYLSVATNTGIRMTAKDREETGKRFRDVLLYALDNPTKNVLDTLYKFFRGNRTRILEPQFVLAGTLHFQKSVAERINCIYTLFRGLTDDQPFRANTTMIRHLLGNMNAQKLDSLLFYIDEKNKE